MSTMTVSNILLHRVRLFPRNPSWLAANSSHYLYLPLTTHNQTSTPFAQLACRSFASGKSKDKDNTNTGIVLYERNPQANFAPRLGLGVTFVHSLYWCWYVLDFIPAVNASPITELHIHPLWGKVPCAVAVAVNIAGCVYATRMVSKIVWKNDDGPADRSTPPLEIYFHNLPFMLPSTKPTYYGVGEVSLNPQFTDVIHLKNMLSKSPTQLQEQQQELFTPGHIPLEAANQHFNKVPLGLYMTRLDDVKNPKLFLDVLLFANAPQLKPAPSKKKQEPSSRGNRKKSKQRSIR